ncbi:MAG: SMC family ATPase [Chloroflexi bacterium]|nr:SMC family ATPase [Chloroflexota bacterium]
MIPLAIKLRNFMCYRDNLPRLSLEGMKLVCLCGDNGNGKSALLDAMTWALWGKARGQEEGKKPGWTMDDLIHTGQTDMEVDFEFAVGNGEYRVLRKRSRSRLSQAGTSSLEFQMRSKDGYISLTSAGINQTEQRITEVLRMDYDTFMNSAYLVQGKADEFTKKAPKDRKEVLATILGLSIYDSYEKKAREALSERKTRRETLEAEIETKRKKLQDMDSFRAELQTVEAELVQVGEKMAAMEQALAATEKQKTGLEVKKGQKDEIDRSLKEMEAELQNAGQQAQAHRQKLKSFENALEKEAEVEKGYSEWQRLARENDECNEKLRLIMALAARIAQMDKEIEKCRSALVAENNSLSQRIAELQKIVSEAPQLLENQKRLQAAIETLAHQAEELNKKRQQLVEAEADVRNLAGANSGIETEIKDFREKLAMLNSPTVSQSEQSNSLNSRTVPPPTSHFSPPTSVCPLCQSELGADGKARLDASYRLLIKEKSDAHRRNLEAMQEQRKTQQALRAEIVTSEQKLKNQSSQRNSELAMVSGKIQQAEEASRHLGTSLTRKRELDAILNEGRFAEAEQTALAGLTAKHRAAGYDEQLHSAIKEGLKKFVRYDTLKKALDEARAGLAQEKALLSQTEKLLAEKTLARQEKTRIRSLLESDLLQLPGITRKWQEQKDILAGLLLRQKSAGTRAGELKGKLDYLQGLRRETEKGEIICRQLREEEKIYSDLAVYFGKKGIQAMLIETAVPEIEEEANSLLARLTENRLSIKMETQKAKKTGTGIDETLDIKIADELGTRDYALFSGGEAFRVNFALRLALSRLLARRAGAPLPTLIVDEGFGTQDAEGRERLIEAIKIIENDFEKVIIITHIDEVKEQFPVRIEVTRGAEGSTFRVN